MRNLSIAALLALTLSAADPNPVTRVWKLNPQAANPALRAVLPDVHAVRTDDSAVYVESAGLSLQSLAPLDLNTSEPTPGARHFVYRFPLTPKPAATPPRTPPGVLGAFVNGVPLYSPTSQISWRDQNLWHQDAVAAAPTPSPVVASLLTGNGKHSPLIGYALDGYPIYGPRGTQGRYRSSYQLRKITRRDTLPDGTTLGPSQEGPPVSAQYPLGTFMEDYEFVPNSGDLDQHNGRFAKTPEYPAGTYAYFLATDPAGRPAYPYLIGDTFYGQIPATDTTKGLKPHPSGPITLYTEATSPHTLVFALHNAKGQRIRFPEKVHEKPIHLIVVSRDLADFAHIHPELQPDDTFAVTHDFPHSGQYWLYADTTLPGHPTSVTRFQLTVPGPTTAPVKTAEILEVRMTPPATLRAGEDLTFKFEVPSGIEPYLGAWAHIMIVSADGRHFIHAHALDEMPTAAESSKDDPWKHTHTAPGPSPTSVTTVTGFEAPGRYRLWLQFQRAGKLIAVPYTLNVEPAKARPVAQPTKDAIRITVSKSGFTPARITVEPGKPLRLAFERKDAENCASSVVFPDLNMKRDLPAGTTTVIDLPALKTGELSFTCGMKMYRGSILAR